MDLTNSIDQSHFEKLTVAQLVKEYPAYYGTKNFSIMFIIVVPSHSRLDLQSGLLPLSILIKIL
jgi:hypothetical protein